MSKVTLHNLNRSPGLVKELCKLTRAVHVVKPAQFMHVQQLFDADHAYQQLRVGVYSGQDNRLWVFNRALDVIHDIMPRADTERFIYKAFPPGTPDREVVVYFRSRLASVIL